MSRTFTPSHNNISRQWHLIDAEGKVLGHIAADISNILMGKNKPTFTPNINVGDNVVVINADKVAVTGKKLLDKKYFKHTGFPGGVKEENLGDLLKRKPADVIKKAVNGMLPKNKLRKDRMRNLFVYAGNVHPHEAQLGKEKN